VKLKAEVILLRQRTGNVEILKEEKRALERRVEGVEGMRRKVGLLERECERLKSAAAASGVGGRSGVGGSSSSGSTPTSAALISLQTENANLLTELGTLRTNLSLITSEKEETERALTALKGEMVSTRQKVVEVERKAGRTEVLLGVEKRESGMLRGLIVSVFVSVCLLFC
jgi:mitotic spindle assembly checkpoint protein MAD1